MVLKGSICVANQYDEQSKDQLIDDARKTDQYPVAISRSRTKSIRNYKRARRNDRQPSRIPYKTETSSLFHKGKVIKGFTVHYIKKNVPSSSEFRKHISPAFRKNMTIKMCTARVQVRRDKSSVVRRVILVVYIFSIDILQAEPPFVFFFFFFFFFFTEVEKRRLCLNRINSLKPPQP